MRLFSNIFGSNKSIHEPGAEPIEVGSNAMGELGPFQLTIDGVFEIKGRGTVATGIVSAGTARVGDSIMIKRINGEQLIESIRGIETMKKSAGAVPGQKVGILFSSIEKDSLGKGDVLMGEPQNNSF